MQRKEQRSVTAETAVTAVNPVTGYDWYGRGCKYDVSNILGDSLPE